MRLEEIEDEIQNIQRGILEFRDGKLQQGYGCSDGNCKIAISRRVTQHTNGGCHCVDQVLYLLREDHAKISVCNYAISSALQIKNKIIKMLLSKIEDLQCKQ